MFSTKRKIEIDISEPGSSIRSTIVERLSEATLLVETFLPIDTEVVPTEGSRKVKNGKTGKQEAFCAQLSRFKIESQSTGGVETEVQRQRVGWILKNLVDKVKLIVSTYLYDMHKK